MQSLPDSAGTAPAIALPRLGAARLRIVGWWAVSRGAVVTTALVVHAVRRPHGYFDADVAHHPIALLGLWDGEWYRRVAEHGYLLVAHKQSDPAFFPLYPVLLRAAHALGLPYGVAGVAISNVAFLLALVVLYELGRELLPEHLAYRATTLAAVFPLGYVFSMAYPESIVLAGMAGAALLALRGRWFACAIAVAAATLARPEALFVAIPVGAVAASRWRSLEPQQRGGALAATLAAPAALVSFPLYLDWTLHDPFAWNRAQTAWGRSFRVDGFTHAVATLPGTPHPWLYRDAALFVVYLALIGAAARAGVGRAWIAAALLIVVLPVWSGSFESEGRFGLLAVPVYWGLAAALRRPWLARAAHATCLALLVAGTVSLKFVFP